MPISSIMPSMMAIPVLPPGTTRLHYLPHEQPHDLARRDPFGPKNEFFFHNRWPVSKPDKCTSLTHIMAFNSGTSIAVEDHLLALQRYLCGPNPPTKRRRDQNVIANPRSQILQELRRSTHILTCAQGFPHENKKASCLKMPPKHKLHPSTKLIVFA